MVILLNLNRLLYWYFNHVENVLNWDSKDLVIIFQENGKNIAINQYYTQSICQQLVPKTQLQPKQLRNSKQLKCQLHKQFLKE